jgi:hypothetical protein
MILRLMVGQSWIPGDKSFDQKILYIHLTRQRVQRVSPDNPLQGQEEVRKKLGRE